MSFGDIDFPPPGGCSFGIDAPFEPDGAENGTVLEPAARPPVMNGGPVMYSTYYWRSGEVVENWQLPITASALAPIPRAPRAVARK